MGRVCASVAQQQEDAENAQVSGHGDGLLVKMTSALMSRISDAFTECCSDDGCKNLFHNVGSMTVK